MNRNVAVELLERLHAAQKQRAIDAVWTDQSGASTRVSAPTWTSIRPGSPIARSRPDRPDVPNGETVLSARTYADFPGPHGRVYRAVVIGTRAHVVAVQGMLRSIRRSSLLELAKLRAVEYIDLPTGHWPQFTRPEELGRAILASVGPA